MTGMESLIEDLRYGPRGSVSDAMAELLTRAADALEDLNHVWDYQQEALRTEAPADGPRSELTSKDGNVLFRLLHAGIGMATEAGEFLDALKRMIWYGQALDLDNLAEEVGDLQWYSALAADAIGTPLVAIQQANLRKLQARYPEKFTQTDALEAHRDRPAEKEAAKGDQADGAECHEPVEIPGLEYARRRFLKLRYGAQDPNDACMANWAAGKCHEWALLLHAPQEHGEPAAELEAKEETDRSEVLTLRTERDLYFDLVHRAVCRAREVGRRMKRPVFMVVAENFIVSDATAARLCTEHGVNPSTGEILSVKAPSAEGGVS